MCDEFFDWIDRSPRAAAWCCVGLILSLCAFFTLLFGLIFLDYSLESSVFYPEEGLGGLCPNIDVVYTWVEEDPSMQKQMELLYPSRKYSAGRYRDFGGLQHSLRSLEANAPWVRNVYIITNGQRPKFLLPDDQLPSNLRVVTHREIFRVDPDTYLPTWNSNAIEVNMGRIPGLAECWIYLNDDVMFGSPVSPSDFYSASTNTSYLYWSGFTVDPDHAVVTNLWRKAVQTSNKLLDARFGVPSRARHFGMHGPMFFVKKYFQEMDDLWTAQYDETAKHPFRTGTDIQLTFLYANYVKEAHKSVTRTSSFDYTKLTNSEYSIRKALEKIGRRKAKFICINDGLPDEGLKYNMPYIKLTYSWYHRYYPTPTKWEDPNWVSPFYDPSLKFKFANGQSSLYVSLCLLFSLM